METLDITAIVLTYNEELHIRRCVESLRQYVTKIYVVDCHSIDATCPIAESLGAEVIQHNWPGNQAEQFNWALDNLKIETEWVLRLDADEYLLPELIEELQKRVPTMPKDVSGIEFKRRHIFMGRWVKHGVYPVVLLRMFRKDCGRYDNRLMDEHIVLSRGQSIVFENDFCDHSLISIEDYCRKHLDYARREAIEELEDYCGLSDSPKLNQIYGKQAQEKRKKKSRFYKKPLFWRSFCYFLYRYFLKGGFLDGKEGFLFSFIQGWWYRTIVDVKVFGAKKACGNDKEKLMEYAKMLREK